MLNHQIFEYKLLKFNILRKLQQFRKFIYFPIIMFVFGILSPQQIFSQETTTVVAIKYDSINYHSAKKASLYSAVLPGLGQAYNKKYWKIPIIYAGFGTLIYFIGVNGGEYRNFKDAYNIVAAGDSANYDNEYVEKYDANLDQLREGRNYYRRNLELNYILTGLLYILNIVDASVDANLYDFDVSDDISLRLEPVRNHNIFYPKPSVGITLRYRF